MMTSELGHPIADIVLPEPDDLALHVQSQPEQRRKTVNGLTRPIGWPFPGCASRRRHSSVGVDEVEELPLLALGNAHQLAPAGLPDEWCRSDVLSARMHVAVEALDGAMT